MASIHPTGVPITLMRAPPDDDLNKYIQNMNAMIEDLELKLMAKKKITDENGDIQFIDDPSCLPLINAEGRNMIVSRLRTYLSPNTYMSMIKEEDTQRNFDLDVLNFSCDLVENHRSYGLREDNFNVIVNLISPLLFMALRKAETDKEMMYRPGSPIKYETTPQPGAGGLLGGLFR